MDFSTLLAVAQENNSKSQSARCYQTKFAPPKKQAKQKVLSDNIKKFIARKEEEQRRKELEEKRKKENLLSLRDHKAQSRINKHLKVCKAANKAVIADAIDTENTAITIAGPSQPDEDDYGYESQSSLLYYNQLMNKYNSQPPEKSIFNNNNEKRTIKDIASTKDRVKQALKQQELEETSGERRKRKSSSSTNVKEAENEKTEKIVEKSNEEIKDEKPKVKKKAMPPPTLSFSELLKIAEKKQHEPVMVEVKPKVEEERPMTKRQKKEYIQEKERREQREKRELEGSRTSVTSVVSSTPSKPQVNKPLKPAEKSVISNSISSKSSSTIAAAVSKKSSEHSAEKLSKSTIKNELLEERKKLEAERKQLEEMRRSIEEEKRKLEQSKSKQEDVRSNNKIAAKSKPADKPTLKDIKPRQFPPADLKPTLANVKPKQFPPADLRPVKSKPLVKKPPVSTKRRIYDEDEEESDLDGFIDDGPDQDDHSHVSRHISEIFGYDRTKYADEDDDDAAMESNYAQQLKEEYVSTKIGIMEDLEDMKMEALEKKRKALMMKKKIKK